MESQYLVSAEWLNSNLGNDKLVVLDASLKPITVENGKDVKSIIPTSRKFDLKGVFSDVNHAFDHMLPDAADFVREMKSLGVCDDSIIVVYDNQGVYSSPRAWYMIKSMGHRDIYVLNGGLIDWIDKGFPVVEYIPQKYKQGNFSNRLNRDYVYFCDSNKVFKNIDNPDYKIIDARSEKRFFGQEPEPRPSLKSGHIPNSINLPFNEVIDKGKFKDVKALKAMFSSLIEEDSLLIFSCGSGITSCIVALAAQISGYEHIEIYDGSWSEWGNENSSFPITIN